jgi:late competence protein required for DNA uptake (superfamily II DNA/RNA helicase)
VGKINKKSLANIFKSGKTEIMQETVEQFLARGGKIKVIKTNMDWVKNIQPRTRFHYGNPSKKISAAAVEPGGRIEPCRPHKSWPNYKKKRGK